MYLPLDVTPKTGASATAPDVLTSWSPVINEETGVMRPEDRKVDTLPRLSFDRDADFVVALRREGESRVVVQERYECLRAMMMWRIGARRPLRGSACCRLADVPHHRAGLAHGAHGERAWSGDDRRAVRRANLRDGAAARGRRQPGARRLRLAGRLLLRRRLRGSAPAVAAAQLLEPGGNAGA